MGMSEPADLVIIGGGLAGLSLAARLARIGAGGRVRILEPRRRYEDDRSWAFWTPADGALAASATRIWKRWRFSAEGGEARSVAAAGWRYAYLRSSDVYESALREIAAAPRISLELGVTVHGLVEGPAEREVQSSTGTIAARYVVDTRPPQASRFARSPLFQSFVGRELQLDGHCIDDSEVELMTDMRVDARGLVFSYVLPLASDRVLVEATRFATLPITATSLQADLDALIDRRGWSRGRVLRSEYGALPMGLPEADAVSHDPRVVRAGAGGGALRAASGYGYLRIQSWADRCAESLRDRDAPVGHPPEPRIRRAMDRVFLRALAMHPQRAPEFFMRLASALPGAAFARFMTDQASAADLARVVASLPPLPFLRALRAAPANAGLPA